MPNKDDQPLTAADHRIPVVAHMMTPGVVQIPGDVSVAEAASLLEREQIPCLLVKDTETRFGLMTPTDIVKKVIAHGLEPDEIEVRTIMTRPVQFIEYDQALEEASSLMLSAGTSILIVTREDQPVGVLTARDLVLPPKRCPTAIRATMSLSEGNRHESQLNVTITQISHVGASVTCSTVPVPGSKVLLSFSLPNRADSMTVRGTVFHDDERRQSDIRDSPAQKVDILFTDLSPGDQSKIKAWVLQNSPQKSDLS